MTLISLPPYLKTIIKHQVENSIQFTSYDSFHSNNHAVEGSQNNISEVWEYINFYKIKHRRALKDISEALEQTTNYSNKV